MSSLFFLSTALVFIVTGFQPIILHINSTQDYGTKSELHAHMIHQFSSYYKQLKYYNGQFYYNPQNAYDKIIQETLEKGKKMMYLRTTMLEKNAQKAAEINDKIERKIQNKNCIENSNAYYHEGMAKLKVKVILFLPILS